MAYLKLTITDTMSFWDNYIEDYVFSTEQSKTFTTWYRLPEVWFRDSVLVAEKRDALLKHLYGETWRLGNGDGSRYVVLALEDHMLSLSEVADRPWARAGGSCYALGDNGTLANVEPNAL